MSFKKVMTSVITLILLGIFGILAMPYVKGEKHLLNNEQHEVVKAKETTKEKSKQSEASQLEDALKKQDVYAYDANYIVQHDEFKSLYPDMLQALIKNNTSKDIKDIQFGFVAWDKNGLPIKLKGNIDFGKSYFRGAKGDAVNIPPKGKFGDKNGFSIDKDLEVDAFKPIVVSYTDFEGHTWKNPKLEAFLKIYEGKRIKDIEDAKKYIFYKDKKVESSKEDKAKEKSTLPKDLNQDKFDEVSKNIEEKSKVSKEELEAYLAYLKLAGLLAYLDAYEAMNGIDDIYDYYDVEQTDPSEYDFNDYDFSSDDMSDDNTGGSDSGSDYTEVEPSYEESTEAVEEDTVEETVEDTTEVPSEDYYEDIQPNESTEEYIEEMTETQDMNDNATVESETLE
ncbi:DUF5780 domain-containing protein [Macrococcus capreoli]|uniref:DUF5780 domain-containing protein n=1 Tax=Macrococcus capreoli TaxID=2982690 RepID=UPI003EE72252